MQLGISSYTFPWSVGVDGFLPEHPMGVLNLLYEAHQMGVDRLQIADNLPLHTLPAEEVKSLAAEAKSRDIQLEIGTRRLEKDHITKYLDLAKQLDSPFLRVVIDDVGYEPDMSTIIDIIQGLIPILESHDMVLAIENHDRFSANSLAHIIKATSENRIGICLDTANSLGAGEGIMQVVEALAPYTVNLHVKDITIRRLSHKMGFEVLGCAAGQGDLDIPQLLSSLKPYNRCKSLTLEVWSDYLNTIRDTINRERIWASKSIDYLKQILKN